jgi:ArsR family transcriptional regulator
MALARYVETLQLLGDESRLRLCALLRGRELCVTDLARVTGIAQPRVSTHLGRLREAGLVRDRRAGQQAFYGLRLDALPDAARAVLDGALAAGGETLAEDRRRLDALDAERREGLPESLADDLERYYSPGRTWQSLALGVAGLLRLGDALDVGCGDGAAAGAIAAQCRSLVCVDRDPRMVEATRERLASQPHAKVIEADAQDLPLGDGSFDVALVFHTLTYAERPAKVLAECARVLRPGGRLVLLCLDEHQQQALTAPYGERHAGFSPRRVREMLRRAGLEVRSAEVACREPRRAQLQVVLAVAERPPADRRART